MTNISEWTNSVISIPEQSSIYKWFNSIDCKFIIAEYDSLMEKTYFCFLPKYKWTKVINVWDYELIHSGSGLVYLDGKIEDWKQADLEFFEKYSGKTLHFFLEGKDVLVPDMLEMAIISAI